VPDIYPTLYRTLLRRIAPERAHRLGLVGLRSAQRFGGLPFLRRFAAADDSRLQCRLFGLSFANPLGVAAGMDKDAEAIPALFALGFGHIEVGTVTPRPQPGNDRPRLWRLPAERALVNALGFPSRGAHAMKTALERLDRTQLPVNGVLGINLGKNRDTPLQEAATDYADLISALDPLADYFTINVSSPNTPGLRELQQATYLRELLAKAKDALAQAARARGGPERPLLLKLSPDLPDEQLPPVAEAALAGGVSGLVATNTTIEREGVAPAWRSLPGGLSGPPLKERSRHVIKLLYRTVGDHVPIIGVGGVGSATDALAHIRAGASLVQLYTAFVYGGPATAGKILSDMLAVADAEKWSHVSELVGVDTRRG
jgi:dihydroorotate dehydrogenase